MERFVNQRSIERYLSVIKGYLINLPTRHNAGRYSSCCPKNKGTSELAQTNQSPAEGQ
jgi:hypothetical protein